MATKKKKTVKKKTHHCVTISYRMSDYRRVKKEADEKHLPVATYLKMLSLQG